MPQGVPAQNGHLLKPRLDDEANWGTTVTGDLGDFTRKYERLKSEAGAQGDDWGPHTRFALTSQFSEDGSDYRMKIEPQGELSVPRVEQVWDVDSVLIFLEEGDEFPLGEGHTLFYTPMNHADFTLQSSLHIPPINVAGASTLTGSRSKWLEPHMMPNALFGFIAGSNCPRILVRLLFPRLAEKRSSKDKNVISKERMQEIYDRIVRPAVAAEITRGLLNAWPLTWMCEQFRATRQNGQIVQTPYGLPGPCVTRVFQQMRDVIRQNPDLKDYSDFIVQIQVQSTKHGTHHGPIPIGQPGSVEDWIIDKRELALKLAVAPIDIMRLPPQKTYVDVGVYLHLADYGYSILPKTANLAWLLSAVTGISVADAAERIAAGAKSGFFIDEVAQTGCFAGCRLTFKARFDESPLGVIYIQVYTSDRNLTSLKDKQYFAKHVEPKEVLQKYPHVLNGHYNRLIDSYEEARAQQSPIDTQIEVRVLLMELFNVLHPLPAETLTGCFAPSRSRDVWHWKKLRAESCAVVLSKLWLAFPTADRTQIHAPLTLLCATVWIGNATANRPDDSSDFRALGDSISTLGAVFLHSLEETPIPRICSHRILGTKTIGRLLGIVGSTPESDILKMVYREQQEEETAEPLPTWGGGSEEHEDHQSGSKRPAAEWGGPSRKQRLRIHNPRGEDIIEMNDPNIPEAPAGNAYDSEDEDPEQLPRAPQNAEMINRIFKAMAGEILLKTQETAESPDVLATNRKRALEIKKGKDGQKKKAYMQGLAQLSFYQDWERLLSDRSLTDKQKDDLVQYARDRLSSEAGWLPVGASDRLWSDSSAGQARTHGESVNGNRGTVVVINPALECNMDIPGGRL
ncbi:hypothetical protein RhiLY_12688 [Ceratobasidium sp. AG-Ba]|nr:hypothetical protein RhiLY_12688 [Ceratobasidium sp. AG-Ba]